MVKQEPIRSCIGCRKSRPKRELLRIVRTGEGKIEVDLSGKLNGRGAYICKEDQCLKGVFKKGRLAQALKIKPTGIDMEELAKEIREKAGLQNGQESNSKR